MLKILTGLLISAGALWWAFRRLEWNEFVLAFSQADLMFILLASSMLILSVPLRGIRWARFIEPMKKVSPALMTSATFVGYFGNNTLPFRLGELVRAYYVAVRTGMRMTHVLSSVLVERLVDVSTLVMILLLYPVLTTIPEELLVPIRWAGGISLAATGMMVWLILGHQIPFIKGRLLSLIDNLRLGFRNLRKTEHLVSMVLLTLGIWILYYMSVFFVQKALGMSLTLGQTYTILIASTMIVAVPAAPGMIGTFHAVIILVYHNIMGVDLAVAQAAAIILHAVAFVPYTLFGAGFYFGAHIHFSDVKARSKKIQEAGTK